MNSRHETEQGVDDFSLPSSEKTFAGVTQSVIISSHEHSHKITDNDHNNRECKSDVICAYLIILSVFWIEN